MVRIWVEYDGGTVQERQIARIARSVGAKFVATTGSTRNRDGAVAVIDAADPETFGAEFVDPETFGGEFVATTRNRTLEALVARLEDAGFTEYESEDNDE